ncbi:MAG: glycoside hydrolase family 3 N-terminal domain-containing protein [Bacteroidota bacterium]
MFKSFSQDTLSPHFILSDFFIPNPALDIKVNMIFDAMTDEQRVGQMIMSSGAKVGKNKDTVARLIREQKIGGVILLVGTKYEFKNYTKYFDSLSVANGGLPLVFAADAELSLFNMKIKETIPVKYANKIKSAEEVRLESEKIVKELKEMGISYNFAPVVDLSPNETVSFRSFGLSKDTIIKYSNVFIDVMQKNNIAATAKHFPGHGYVKGDTHKKLVFIEGTMKEVEVYLPLIQNNVASVMVGHIAVSNNTKYDTDSLPATVSRNIITGLLKGEMGYKGIVITDAMAMKGVSSVPHCGLKSVMAGSDIILMPEKEYEVYYDILNEIKKNEEFKNQAYESIKKIIRFKICLGLIK